MPPIARGLVATIANFLFSHGGNIPHADQHQDAELASSSSSTQGRRGFVLTATGLLIIRHHRHPKQ
jgi:formyltetrahydrofolate hydrolase